MEKIPGSPLEEAAPNDKLLESDSAPNNPAGESTAAADCYVADAGASFGPVVIDATPLEVMPIEAMPAEAMPAEAMSIEATEFEITEEAGLLFTEGQTGACGIFEKHCAITEETGILTEAAYAVADEVYPADAEAAMRVSAFSSAAYGLDLFEAPTESLDDLAVPGEDEDSGIPWRGKNALEGMSFDAAEPLRLSVLHGDEILEADDPVFLKQFLEEPEEDRAAEDSALVVGVKFRQYGPVYFFTANGHPVQTASKVLVETEHGPGLAQVMAKRRLRLPLPTLRGENGTEIFIKPISGMAGPEDIAASADNHILASSALLHCKECIRERNLDMKLVDVEVLHNRSKIIFYFTAPSRIDFRELVKDLVRTYRTRIELRQIGVRHETQMLGALGNCGMACCCRRYLRRFAPVTIKMAKEQNLFLNPTKLSGICGRLLCCLSYEQENYEEFHRNCPKTGKKYNTDKGQLKVMRANLFKQSITVASEGGEEMEFSLEEWHDLRPQRLEGAENRDAKPDEKKRHKGQPDEESLGWNTDEDLDPQLLKALLQEDAPDNVPQPRPAPGNQPQNQPGHTQHGGRRPEGHAEKRQPGGRPFGNNAEKRRQPQQGQPPHAPHAPHAENEGEKRPERFRPNQPKGPHKGRPEDKRSPHNGQEEAKPKSNIFGLNPNLRGDKPAPKGQDQ